MRFVIFGLLLTILAIIFFYGDKDDIIMAKVFAFTGTMALCAATCPFVKD